MSIRTVLVEFQNGPSGLEPRDPALYSQVIEYCHDELAVVPELRNFLKSYAVVEFGEQEEILAIHGVACYGMRPDIGVFRVTGKFARRATKQLFDRLNAHFADNGWRGNEVFLFISDKETPEQRCPAWQESLKAVGAKPAQRFAVTVR
jgi:hypothetical protein